MLDCHVALLQQKERGMKRSRYNLNDGDEVVIHKLSKEHKRDRKEERDAGSMGRGTVENRLIETGVRKDSQRHLEG